MISLGCLPCVCFSFILSFMKGEKASPSIESRRERFGLTLSALKARSEGQEHMRKHLWSVSLLLLVLVSAPGTALAQANHQSRTLVVNGQAGQADVIKIDGRSYVDMEALARITNGSLRFKESRILLNLPASTASVSTVAPPPTPVDDFGLSRNFMKAGIEAIAGMREWASPLAYAIQNGYNVTDSWVATYREQASHNISLASAAATTEADRNALQLLNNEFQAVLQWSNKLIEAKKSMDTGKYALSPNALRDEPLSQKIITCGHFLASMFGSGSFQDDASCH